MDFLAVAWNTINAQGDQFVALAFALIGAFVLYLFRLRPILLFGRAHASLHNLNLANKSIEPPEPDNFLEVYNEQFFILNQGKKAANDVSVVLSHFPRNVSINPGQPVAFERIENGQCLIKLDYVAAGELIQLDCIYLNQRAAFIASVRSSESVGRQVSFFTVRQFSPPVYWLISAILLLGIAFVLQFAIQVFFTGP